MEYTAAEIFRLLNEVDETPRIEAKLGTEAGKSIVETICAFANEPDLNGGYILLGVQRMEDSLFPGYKIVGVENPDKLQLDIVSQCNTMLTGVVRPIFKVEVVGGKTLIVVYVSELAQSQKPIYFTNLGLPKGVMRRCGSADIHCTIDDLPVFFHGSTTTFDSTPVPYTSMADIDPTAVQRYRDLRAIANPGAEELTFNDPDLLRALGCVNKKSPDELNLAGLLLFGSAASQRSHYPSLRIDYIRVPGNEWVKDVNERFTTIDMRGPLLINVFRVVEAIYADLPKGFLLRDEDIQAKSTAALPFKVLREAVVNAIMHRSYRDHSPTQIIRYDNRIEIINPGFSLKNEETFYQPGSEIRNQFIATAFHETNLAETKGSGIKAMRKMMKDAKLSLPTFESNRATNKFTARLLLHHFLDKEDLEWLSNFSKFSLNDNQLQALVFVREVHAIDNQTYRQMSDCDTLRASKDLRALKQHGLLENAGGGKGTYYVAGPELTIGNQINKPDSAVASGLSAGAVSVSAVATSVNAEGIEHSAGATSMTHAANNIQVYDDQLLTNADFLLSTEALQLDRQQLIALLPFALQGKIKGLKQRDTEDKIKDLITELCTIRPLRLIELASILQKGDNYIRRRYLKNLIADGVLEFVQADTTHPGQAYRIKK